MSTIITPSVTLSRQTLDNTPVRALAFLRAVGTDPRIHSALAAAGFTDKDVERGWALVRSVFGAAKPTPAAAHNPVATAMEQLEAWNGPGFLRARAALRHLHPEQESFVFDGLDVGHGAEAVLSVATFLDRCAQLESGKDRKSTHKADLAAIDTLEKRGVTRSERKRLAQMVSIVETQAAPIPEAGPAPVAERDAEIMLLRAWLSTGPTPRAPSSRAATSSFASASASAARRRPRRWTRRRRLHRRRRQRRPDPSRRSRSR